MPLPSQPEIDSLKATHGVATLRHFELAGVDVLCRPPSEVDYRRFKTQIQDENKRANATDTLVLSCTVWPAKEDFRAILKTKPGIIESIAGELVEWAGVTKDIEKKDI